MRLDADIWSKKETRTKSNPRLYDVRITLNKSGGEKRMVVRFGFINKAAEAFKGFEYIEFSDIEKLTDRIYFRLYNHEVPPEAHRLSYGQGNGQSRYAALTPTVKGEKLYRMKWVGGTFPIKLDEECNLYYIELEQEAEE